MYFAHTVKVVLRGTKHPIGWTPFLQTSPSPLFSHFNHLSRFFILTAINKSVVWNWDTAYISAKFRYQREIDTEQTEH